MHTTVCLFSARTRDKDDQRQPAAQKEFKIGLQHCTVKVRCFGEGQVHTSGWVCDCVWCGVCQPALDGSLRWPAHGAASSASAAGSHGYDRDHSVRRRRVSDCHTHTHKQHTHTQTAHSSHTLFSSLSHLPFLPLQQTTPAHPNHAPTLLSDVSLAVKASRVRHQRSNQHRTPRVRAY
jgi:hypothetical protein